MSGATWTSQGKFGGALSFDGVNDWVTVADANALDLTTGMTLEAWVYPTASGSGSWRNVIIKERPGGEVYNLYANTDTNVPAAYVVRAAQPGIPLDARGTAAVPLNTWTHLAVTYDGTTLRLFVNGTQVGSRAVSGALLTSSGVLRIGGNSLWGELFRSDRRGPYVQSGPHSGRNPGRYECTGQPVAESKRCQQSERKNQNEPVSQLSSSPCRTSDVSR